LENFHCPSCENKQSLNFAHSACARFVAATFTDAPSVIQLFETEHGKMIKSLESGLSSHERSFCWVPGLKATLAAVSSAGHFSLYAVVEGTTPQVGKKHVPVPFGLKLASNRFQKILFSKSGDFCVIITAHELIVLPRNLSTYEFPQKAIVFSTGEPDCVFSADIHPSGTAIALTSSKRNSVLIIAINGGKNMSEIHTQLSRQPLQAAEEDDGKKKTVPSPEDKEWFAPCILNEITLTGRRGPVACGWSKYGESLALASSEQFMSVWNIPARQIDTVAIDSCCVIRALAFLSDSLVAVSVNDTNKVFLVNVDDGILFDSNETALPGASPGSKCTSLTVVSHSPRDTPGIILARAGPQAAQLARWLISVN
jgi:WD40 repeat protein